MNCFAIAAIGLHLVSWHDEPGYNNTNPGVYVKSECGLTAGVYKNSFSRVSVYGAYSYDPPKLPFWASAGFATGYAKIPGTNFRLSPIAIVGLKSPQYKGYLFRVGYIPKIGGVNNVNVVHLMIEKAF